MVNQWSTSGQPVVNQWQPRQPSGIRAIKAIKATKATRATKATKRIRATKATSGNQSATECDQAPNTVTITEIEQEFEDHDGEHGRDADAGIEAMREWMKAQEPPVDPDDPKGLFGNVGQSGR